MTLFLHLRSTRPIWTALVLVGVLSCGGSPGPGDPEEGPAWFVSADARPGGDGSQDRPFATFAEVQTASAPGDTIYVVAADAPLVGAIRLQARQRLLGWGPGGPGSDRASLAGPEAPDSPAVIALSVENEVGHLDIRDLHSHGIVGTDDFGGAWLHDLEFSRAVPPAGGEEALPDGFRWAIRLAAGSGDGHSARIEDVTVRGEDPQGGDVLAGIQIVHEGDAAGTYTITRGSFTHLGGRAVHLLTQDTSRLEAEVLDSSADNIGLGRRNSDSILPHLRDSSRQDVTVRDYRYANTQGVGSPSNTGLEAFLEGPPFPNLDDRCDGCRLDLVIEGSVFDAPITDGIQLINFGSRSGIHAVIRDTRVLNAAPQQVGGGISLLAQNAENEGNQNSLLVERSDIVGSSQFGVAVRNTGSALEVDLGGGSLGSSGGNRILDSASGEISLDGATVTAKNNWWGGQEPRVEVSGEGAATTEPTLAEDPRPEP